MSEIERLREYREHHEFAVQQISEALGVEINTVGDLLKEVMRLRDELATNARLLARQCDLAREAETGDKVYPIFDILPRLFRTGHYIDEQDGRWWLFDAKGEGVISGETYRSLCINIIFMEL